MLLALTPDTHATIQPDGSCGSRFAFSNGGFGEIRMAVDSLEESSGLANLENPRHRRLQTDSCLMINASPTAGPLGLLPLTLTGSK
jgi:hypothetical protein